MNKNSKKEAKPQKKRVWGYSKYREQISGYDCVPTSFVNALIYLFERNEIPAEVVRRIYEYTLDVPKSGATTVYAIELLSNWLSSFKNDKFAVSIDVQKGTTVHFEKAPFFTQTKKSTCALIRVFMGVSTWHFITLFYEKDGWVYCFDPCPGSKNSQNWKWIQPSELNDGCNLKIKKSHLNKLESDSKFKAGENENRVLVLIERKSPRKKKGTK